MNGFDEELLEPSEPPNLDEVQVCRYLESSPEFFERHQEFLFNLYRFPEPTDSRSLTSRQLKVYRQKCQDLEKRLGDLMETGRMNAGIFLRTAKICLSMLDCETLADLDNTLASELVVGWKLQHATILVVNWTSPEVCRYIRSASPTDRELRRRLFERSGPSCETWRAEEYNALIGENVLDSPGSVAIIPIYRSDISAALLLGSEDPDRFAQQKGTMFLVFLGEIVARVLDRLL